MSVYTSIMETLPNRAQRVREPPWGIYHLFFVDLNGAANTRGVGGGLVGHILTFPLGIPTNGGSRPVGDPGLIRSMTSS